MGYAKQCANIHPPKDTAAQCMAAPFHFENKKTKIMIPKPR